MLLAQSAANLDDVRLEASSTVARILVEQVRQLPTSVCVLCTCACLYVCQCVSVFIDGFFLTPELSSSGQVPVEGKLDGSAHFPYWHLRALAAAGGEL